MNKKNKLSCKALGLLVLLLALISCSKSEPKYQGYIEGENLFLTSPYSGILKKIYVQRGERVEKGKLLFVLDANPQALSIDELEASLMQTEETLIDLTKPKRPEELAAIKAQIAQTQDKIALAEIRVERFGTLYRQNAGDKDTYDAAVELLNELRNVNKEYTANLELAELGARDNQINAQAAAVVSIRAKLNNVRWQLAQKEIVAPADGLIFDTYYKEGEFVSSEKPIAALLAPLYVFIEFFVPLSTLQTNNLKVGNEILFSYQGIKQPRTAKISYISPEAEFLPPLVYSRENDNKIVFRVKARVPNNDQQLFPGLPVIVGIKHG